MRNCEKTERVATLLEMCQDQPDLFNELFLNRPAYSSRQMDLCRSVVEYRTTVAYSGKRKAKETLLFTADVWRI